MLWRSWMIMTEWQTQRETDTHTHTVCLCSGFAPRKYIAYFKGSEPHFHLCWAEHLRLSYCSKLQFLWLCVAAATLNERFTLEAHVGSRVCPCTVKPLFAELHTKEEKGRASCHATTSELLIHTAPPKAQASEDHGVLDFIPVFFIVCPEQGDN